MSFSDRSHVFRKSDPGHKNKGRKERTNNPNDQESIAEIKRRGASLVRSDFNRQNSLTSSSREVISKRNSELAIYQGGTKFMNFLKSNINLSKFKSKSKANLQDKRQSLYTSSQSSKSEENLIGLEFDCYLTSIRVTSLLLNDDDPTLYTMTFTSSGESLYKKLVRLDNNCTIQPVHPSIINGQQYCFQIIKRLTSETTVNQFQTLKDTRDSFSNSQITKSCSYNSSFRDHKLATEACDLVNIIRCVSTVQRNEWILKLKKHINPNIEYTVRHEDILKIWIQEAKNLLTKKKYMCEIRLDQILYGRTTIKCMNDTVFWGEEFDFTGLKNVSVISIYLYRIIDVKRKRDKSELVAVVNLSCSDFLQNTFTEQWYSPSPDIHISSNNLRFSHTKANISSATITDEHQKSVINATPVLRIKARYRPLEIIPTNCYQPLLDFIIIDNIALTIALENHLKVKSKEEFVHALVFILQKKGRHVEFLSDIVLTEVFKADDNLILRGNSMASKAMECYLKIVGEKYLSTILMDTTTQVTLEEIDCEVDPLKLPHGKDTSLIKSNQKKLLNLIEAVWNKIYTNSHLLPNDLRSVFCMIREKINSVKQAPANPASMIDQVISSFLFLRFICPAIMSPFLFGLVNEYSDKPCVNRTFTLIAKSIQSLANLSQSHQGKESYMGFLQNFLTSKTEHMRSFLKEISTPSLSVQNRYYLGDIQQGPLPKLCMSVDLGYQLAEISYQLSIHLREIDVKDYTPALVKVRSILESMSKTFPSIDRSVEHKNMSQIDHNFRSQIPVPIPKRPLRQPSVLSKTELPYPAFSSIQCSADRRKDIEENFSYIPHKYSHNQPGYSDKIQKLGNDNYVDFECIDSKGYDETYMHDTFPSRSLPVTKRLNEKEINNNWSKVVKELSHISPPPDHAFFDSQTGTYNSSGYESLNLPTKISNLSDLKPPTVQRHASHAGIERVTENNNALRKPVTQTKSCVAHPANVFRRITRTSTSSSSSNNVKLSNNPKLSYPNATLGSIEIMSGSGNTNLQSSKSLSSVNQVENANITDPDLTSSVENMNSSMAQLFRRSSQSLSNSISSNIDLDSFVSNELIRLKHFLEYYEIPKPSMYQGNAVDQYKYRTIDENCLKRILIKKSNLSRNEIINHIQAGYRLLKSINKPGLLSVEFVVKSVMEINQRVQTLIKVEFDRVHLVTHEHINYNGKTDAKPLSQAQRTTASFSLSTQSLPSPLSKYSKQSPQSNLICSNSQEVTQTTNLAVHGVFERY